MSRSGKGEPLRLTVSGHAGRGPYGSDVVCAAASALVETLRIGFERVLRQPYQGAIEEGAADLAWTVPLSSEARAVVETICQALRDLAATEPTAVRYREISEQG